MTAHIVAERLRRTYRPRGKPEVEALRGLDLRIERGELFGLLGPNGSGKTTLVRILATLLSPTAGRAAIGGHDVSTAVGRVRREIGVAFGGERGLYDRLTAMDNLLFAGELYGVSGRRARQRATELLGRVALDDAADRRVEGFSRGMKQRLHIARALMHRPTVVFLDEPSSGLDPVAARAVRELVRDVHTGGTTVLLTTHHMFEADQLCDRVGILVDGRLPVVGTPGSLKADAEAGRSFHVETHRSIERAIAVLAERDDVLDVQEHSHDGVARWVVRVSVRTGLHASAVADALGIPPVEVVERAPTLEDAYVAIVSGARA